MVEFCFNFPFFFGYNTAISVNHILKFINYGNILH